MTTNPGQPNPDQTRPCPTENTVNGCLTPKRGRPVTENSEYAAFARRILRAYSRRIATGDVESLAHLINGQRSHHADKIKTAREITAEIAAGAVGYGEGMCCCAAMTTRTAA